jgi:hypothetical protein
MGARYSPARPVPVRFAGIARGAAATCLRKNVAELLTVSATILFAVSTTHEKITGRQHPSLLTQNN